MSIIEKMADRKMAVTAPPSPAPPSPAHRSDGNVVVAVAVPLCLGAVGAALLWARRRKLLWWREAGGVTETTPLVV